MRRPKEDLLPEMNDKQLESQTTDEIWLCELTLGKHWAEDVSHRASGKDECRRTWQTRDFQAGQTTSLDKDKLG